MIDPALESFQCCATLPLIFCPSHLPQNPFSGKSDQWSKLMFFGYKTWNWVHLILTVWCIFSDNENSSRISGNKLKNLFCLPSMPGTSTSLSLMDFPAQKMPARLHLLSFLCLIFLRKHSSYFLDLTFIQDFKSWRQIKDALSADSVGFLNFGILRCSNFHSLWHGLDPCIFWHCQALKIKENSLCYALDCSKW